MIIEREHFPYLYVQRGEVSHVYLAEGFESWKDSFELSMKLIVRSMAPVLPQTCHSILDIGGGLGALGVLLHEKYPDASYSVIDGVDNSPEVHRHSEPFNNAKVGSDFLTRNGLTDFKFYAPDTMAFGREFDLVVSTAAWGFHIPPREYISRVRGALASKATIVLDVRKTKPEWLHELCRTFGNYTLGLEVGKKYVRVAWTI